MGASARAAAAPGITALQQALSAENAAVYGYGLAGAQLNGGQLNAARQDWTVHRIAGATLSEMITKRGAQPAAATAAYRPPFPVTGAAAAVSLATMLEDGLVTAYVGLVAQDDLALRAFGARQMQAAAIRAAFWRGGTIAFPGLPASAL
jgi:Domain of unknown function (DUF4439)